MEITATILNIEVMSEWTNVTIARSDGVNEVVQARVGASNDEIIAAVGNRLHALQAIDYSGLIKKTVTVSVDEKSGALSFAAD